MIPLSSIESIGFSKVQERYHENDFSYDWYRLEVNEFQIDMTIEYEENKPTVQYFELEGKELKGLKTLKKLNQLIKIL